MGLDGHLISDLVIGLNLGDAQSDIIFFLVFLLSQSDAKFKADEFSRKR